MSEPFNHSSPPAEEAQGDLSTEKVVRRSLLALALIGLLAPCGLCWYSTTVEAVELILIPTLMGIVVGLFSAYTFYQKEQKQDLAPPLWRVSLVFLGLVVILGLAMIWLVRAAGWQNLPGGIVLILGIWSLYLAGRRIWEAWQFSQQSVEEENDLAVLDMISIRGSHPVHPLLVYHYAGNYRGQMQNDRIHKYAAEIQQAVQEGKFRVTVEYLPENPRVHRLKSWRIVP